MDEVILMKAASAVKKKKYKCPYCETRVERDKLYLHIEDKHEDLVPPGYTARRVAFNYLNNKTEGHCIICGNVTEWNEDKCRYERLCNNPKCKEAYKKMCAERNQKKYGTDRLQSDPRYKEEVEKKALAGRKISGKYRFQDGGVLDYVGSYEKKFLEFMDKIMNINSEDLQGPGPVFEYNLYGESKLYITDFYYVPYNLIIEIKDGGSNPNNNPEWRKRREAMEIAKEDAVRANGKYNYVKLTDNQFDQIMVIMAELKFQMIDGCYDPIININESTLLESNMNKYDPPYSYQEIVDKYGKDVADNLMKDPVHKWRAETGIELIHKEPTLKELNRIWKNWNYMTDDMKHKSDNKSIEFFNLKNAEHYLQLRKEYSVNESTLLESNSRNIYIRVTYDGIGIYEAYKKEIWKKSKDPKSEWIKFKNSEASNWLPLPPEYASHNRSYFTKEGYEMFNRKTLPVMLKYLEKDKIKINKGTINSKDIIYQDKYQVVTESFSLLESKNESHLSDKFKKKTGKDFYFKTINTKDGYDNLSSGQKESYEKYKEYMEGIVAFDKDTDEFAGRVLVYSKWIMYNKYHGNMISGLYVKSKYRGYGLGETLLKKAINMYHGNLLAVATDNEIAIRLYKKYNFRVLGKEIWKKDNNPYYIMGRSGSRVEDVKDESALMESVSSSTKGLYSEAKAYLKKNKFRCEVTIDRPIGYVHHGKVYPINYGYIEGLIGGDGEEQDVYVLGEDKPLKTFSGKIIARICRENDNEEKWVACSLDKNFSKEEIIKETYFMEQFFKSHIIMIDVPYKEFKESTLLEYFSPNIDTVIFDFGGVLVESSEKEKQNVYALADKYGITREELIECIKQYYSVIETDENMTREQARKAVIDAAPEGRKELAADIFDQLGGKSKVLCKHTIPMLESLKKKGYKLYYLSNITRWAYESRKEAGLYKFVDKYFIDGIYSFETGLKKPDPNIFKLFINKFNVIPENCLFVDDKEINIEGAKSVGLNGMVWQRTNTKVSLREINKLKKVKSLNESYIINEKDIYYNKDKFDSGEINLCFIIGHSGSGKSTMAGNMEKSGIEHYELDDLMFIKEKFTLAQLKEYGDLIYSFFTGVGKKFYITKEDLKNIPPEEYEDVLFNRFVDYAKSYANSHKNTKFVIEGIEILYYDSKKQPLFKPQEFKDCAFYIKGTSALISYLRANDRDAKDEAKNVFDYLKNRINMLKHPGVSIRYRLITEKELKVFRNYFKSLMKTTVKESSDMNESMTDVIGGAIVAPHPVPYECDPKNYYIVNHLQNNVYDTYITEDPMQYSMLSIDPEKGYKIFKSDKDKISKKYLTFRIRDTKKAKEVYESLLNMYKNGESAPSKNYIYESLTGNRMLTHDQILYDDRFELVKSFEESLEEQCDQLHNYLLTGSIRSLSEQLADLKEVK